MTAIRSPRFHPCPSTRRVADGALASWAIASRPLRVLALVLATVAAFPWTLLATFETLTLETPLSNIGLIPAVSLAAVIAIGYTNPPRRGPDDRQLDWIVGLFCLGIAVAMAHIVPSHYGVRAWDLRLDVLAMPIFVAGSGVLLFGLRYTARSIRPIGLLLLLWPVPWSAALPHLLRSSQLGTTHLLRAIAPIVGVAEGVGPAHQGRFSIPNEAEAFNLVVGTACAGGNALVGFVVIAVPAMWVIQGSRQRKLAALAVGLAITWAMNAMRILIIFAAGKHYGERVAYEILHPFMGVVTFSAGLLAILALKRPFGLRFAARQAHRPGRDETAGQFRSCCLVLLVAALASFSGNRGVAELRLQQSPVGDPRRDEISTVADTAQLNYHGDYGWGRQFFGSGSKWVRYRHDAAGIRVPVWVDAQSTRNWKTLMAHRPLGCIEWNGWSLRSHRRTEVGTGTRGDLIEYVDSGNRAWTMLTWEWPVKGEQAKQYQRFILQAESKGEPELALRQLARTIEEATLDRTRD